MPAQIGNYFETSATQVSNHTYNLRSQNSNRPPRFISISKTGEKSIQFKGAQIWNAMPLEIKNSESFSIFKTSYKKHLLENDIDSTIFLNQTDLLLSCWLALSIQPHLFLFYFSSHTYILNRPDSRTFYVFLMDKCLLICLLRKLLDFSFKILDFYMVDPLNVDVSLLFIQRACFIYWYRFFALTYWLWYNGCTCTCLFVYCLCLVLYIIFLWFLFLFSIAFFCVPI